MSIGKVLVTAAALTLGSIGAAMAADAMMNIDGLSAVGDGTLSEKHGKDINIDFTSAEGKQKLEQTATQNTFTVSGNVTNGNVSNDGGTNFTGFGNFLANSGNMNNLGQQMSVVVILH